MAYARCLLIGFALAGIAGVHFGADLGLLAGLIIVWLGGNVLSLLLEVAWHCLGAARPSDATPTAPAGVIRRPDPTTRAETPRPA